LTATLAMDAEELLRKLLKSMPFSTIIV